MLYRKISDEQIKEFIDYLDALPVHYITHFAYACEIVGYYHPNKDIREMWNNIYLVICRNFHMTSESKEENEQRLSDNLTKYEENYIITDEGKKYIDNKVNEFKKNNPKLYEHFSEAAVKAIEKEYKKSD